MTMLAAIVLSAITHVPADGTFRYPTNRCTTAALEPTQVLGGCDIAAIKSGNRRVGPETHASVIGSADAWFDRFVIATLTGTGRETNRSERVTRSMFDTGAITNFLYLGSTACELAVPSNRDFRANGPRWNRRPVSVQDEALSGEYYALDIADYSPQQYLSPWKSSPDDLSIAWGSSAMDGFDTYSHPQWTSSFWSMRNDWRKLYPLYWSLGGFQGARSYDFSRLFDNDQYRLVVWADGEDPHFDEMVDSAKGSSGSAGTTADLVAKVSGNSSVTNRFMEYFNGYNLNPIRRLIWSQWSAINGTLAALDRVYVTQDLCPRLSYTNEYCHGMRASSFDVKVRGIEVDEAGTMDMSNCSVSIEDEEIGTNVIDQASAFPSRIIAFNAADSCPGRFGASAAVSYEWPATNLNFYAEPGPHSVELYMWEDPWDYEFLWVGATIDSYHDHPYVSLRHRIGFEELAGSLTIVSDATVTRTIATSDYDYGNPSLDGITASVPARYPHPVSFDLLADRNMQPEIFAMCWEGMHGFGKAYSGNYVQLESLGPLRSVAEYNSAVRGESDALLALLRGYAINDLRGKPCTVEGILANGAENLARRNGPQAIESYLRNLGPQYALCGISPEKATLLIEPDGTARIGSYDGGVFHDVQVLILHGYGAGAGIDFDYNDVSSEYRGGLMTTASVHWNFNTMKREP